MEVVPIRVAKTNGPTTAVGLPFSRRNVQEWSRMDKLTGIMESAKIETDHWTARTNNAAHNYGKVVDSRERNNADGSIQERQKKQMEVFQTKVPGGSMQVIRTQTITTSSKKWSSSSDKGFDDLQLPVNSLDLSSQKTKGSVGRSGSIGGRRPPTRPRSLISQSSNSNVFGEDSSSVFKLCQRLHDQSETREPRNEFLSNFSSPSRRFGSPKKDSDAESDPSGVVITDVTSPESSESSIKNCLTRQKSCSNENIAVDSTNDSLLRRSSKVRRSLQCHKQNYTGLERDPDDEYDETPTKSLKERAAEIEKLLRHGTSTYVSQNSDLPSDSYGKKKFLKTKESFVSAETLKEVRDRLKKPNLSDNETNDDGIVTEKNDYGLSSKINTFERRLQEASVTNKKPSINGTGSLESRYTNKNSPNGTRTSEWYRRRKSYGFEQVDEYDKFDKFNNKKNNQIDSSTDSGICQSSETMGVPSWNKNADSIWTKISQESPLNANKDPLANIVRVRVEKDSKDANPFSFPSCNGSAEKSINSVYLDGQSNGFLSRKEDRKKDDVRHARCGGNYGESSLMREGVWNRKSPIPYQNATENVKSSLRPSRNPWISQLRGTKLVDRNWISDEIGIDDESLQKTNSDESAFPTREEGDTSNQKKGKKVEFCKTEVHFAAESGKFNIVETDGKPPPNDMFRRRRRSTGSTGSPKDTNGLPKTKFGDSPVEKRMLTTPEKVESISEKIEAELKELSRIVIEALPQSEKPESEGFKRKNSWLYDVAEEPVENPEADTPKQNPISRKTYENSFLSEPEFRKSKAQEIGRTSARSPIPASVPVWQSTVVLKNKRFDNLKRDNEDKKMYASDGESELQIRIRNLRKTEPQQKLWDSSPYKNSIEKESETKRRSLPDDFLLRNHGGAICGTLNENSKGSTDESPSLSVAERIKQVEQIRSNNYSTKINFRSGEMTVVQNGTTTVAEEPARFEENGKTMTSWAHQRKIGTFEDAKKDDHSRTSMRDQSVPSCDELTTSNPPVMRFSTHHDKMDNQKYQTTRILINFKTSGKDDANKTEVPPPKNNKNNNENNNSHAGKSTNTYGSWSSGMKKDLNLYLNEFKSTNLLKDTFHSDTSDSTQREHIPKLSKPVHEIIDQFDSLSRKFKEKRRKPIPSSYRSSKEYTHSDLEEELKNFTENLDKDFRDIYEEEIGSFRKSKSLRDSSKKKVESPGKVESFVRPIIQKRSSAYNFSTKSSSDEASKKSSLRTSSRDNYDTDDSDLLADEEVRSYMSAGHGGSDSETDGAYGSTSSRKSFEDSILRFKKLESQIKREIKTHNGSSTISSSAIYPKSNSHNKVQDQNRNSIKSPKISSIALKYEEDPFFTRTHRGALKSKAYCTTNGSSNELSADALDRTSNSSSAMSTKPRERVSYLNGLSLSEKYSKYIQRSSNSSTDTVSDCVTHKPGRTSDNIFDEGKEYYPKTRSESHGHKSKYANRENSVSPIKDEPEKSRKELPVKVKSSQNKFAKSEPVESSRYRVKSATEKQSSHKNPTDKHQTRDHQSSGMKRKERRQTDGAIEELKNAAEEIMNAVNGYTDESSFVGSSEDDRPKRIIKKDKIGSLGTISEGKRVTKTETKRIMATTHGRLIGTHSSASSTESLNHKDSYKPMRELKPSTRHKHGESGKSSSSRSTRMHQRATREYMVGQPSSSEDIPSCVEQVKRRVVRRQKTISSTKPETTSENKSISSRHKSKVKMDVSSTAIKTTKPEKVKEHSSATRSSRSSRTVEGEKTKSSSRKSGTEKQTDIETIRKKRSQRNLSKEEPTATQILRKKICGSKSKEGFKASQST